MDWLDLLALQGTLKSLLQYHSSKASDLRRVYLGKKKKDLGEKKKKKKEWKTKLERKIEWGWSIRPRGTWVFRVWVMENWGTFSNDMSEQSTGNSFVKTVIIVLASQSEYSGALLS